KDDKYSKWMFYFKNDVANFGLSVFGEWMVGGGLNYSIDQNSRRATREEIERHLTQEDIKRGYKGGDTIKDIHGTTHKRPEIYSFYYGQKYDILYTDKGCVVYKAGQWAEIVEQPAQVKRES